VSAPDEVVKHVLLVEEGMYAEMATSVVVGTGVYVEVGMPVVVGVTGVGEVCSSIWVGTEMGMDHSIEVGVRLRVDEGMAQDTESTHGQ